MLDATDALVESLSVTQDNASDETDFCRGAHVRLSWLRKVYGNACNNSPWKIAARAYLLHLVGGTIFAYKNATYLFLPTKYDKHFTNHIQCI